MAINDMGPLQDIVNVGWPSGEHFIAIEWQSTFVSDGSVSTPSERGVNIQFPQFGVSFELGILNQEADPTNPDANDADFATLASFHERVAGSMGPHTIHTQHWEVLIAGHCPGPPPGNGFNFSAGATVYVNCEDGICTWTAGGPYFGDGDFDAFVAYYFATTQCDITEFQPELVEEFDTTYNGASFITDTDNGVMLIHYEKAMEGFPSEDHLNIHIDTGEGPPSSDGFTASYSHHVKVSVTKVNRFDSFPVDDHCLADHWPVSIGFAEQFHGATTPQDANWHYDIVVRPFADPLQNEIPVEFTSATNG